MSFDTNLTVNTKKVKSKYITDLKIKHRTTKLLEKIEGIQDLAIGKDFLDLTAKTHGP